MEKRFRCLRSRLGRVLVSAVGAVGLLGACGACGDSSTGATPFEEGKPEAHPYGGVKDCKSFDPGWAELVVSGAAPNGPANDAALSVAIAGSTGYLFRWHSATIGVDAVLVNGGNVEGIRYTYPNESTFANNLKSPEGFIGPGGSMAPRLISSVSFCYDRDSATTTSESSVATTTTIAASAASTTTTAAAGPATTAVAPATTAPPTTAAPQSTTTPAPPSTTSTAAPTTTSPAPR